MLSVCARNTWSAPYLSIVRRSSLLSAVCHVVMVRAIRVVCESVLECVGVCESVLECVGVCWSVLECVGVCWNVWVCVGVCWSV